MSKILDALSSLRKTLNDPFGLKAKESSGDFSSIDTQNKEILNGFENLNRSLDKDSELDSANFRNIQRLRKESSGL